MFTEFWRISNGHEMPLYIIDLYGIYYAAMVYVISYSKSYDALMWTRTWTLQICKKIWHMNTNVFVFYYFVDTWRIMHGRARTRERGAHNAQNQSRMHKHTCTQKRTPGNPTLSVPKMCWRGERERTQCTEPVTRRMHKHTLGHMHT